MRAWTIRRVRRRDKRLDSIRSKAVGSFVIIRFIIVTLPAFTDNFLDQFSPLFVIKFQHSFPLSGFNTSLPRKNFDVSTAVSIALSSSRNRPTFPPPAIFRYTPTSTALSASRSHDGFVVLEGFSAGLYSLPSSFFESCFKIFFENICNLLSSSTSYYRHSLSRRQINFRPYVQGSLQHPPDGAPKSPQLTRLLVENRFVQWN